MIPARAEFAVDCRLPPGLGDDVAERRARELLGGADDGLELDFTEAVVGNRSPVDTPLMDAIADWVGDGRPRRRGGAGRAARLHRLALVPGRVPRLRRLRLLPPAPPDLYESWPLMHSADERLDVRDLGFATEFFADLPRRLLT